MVVGISHCLSYGLKGLNSVEVMFFGLHNYNTLISPTKSHCRVSRAAYPFRMQRGAITARHTPSLHGPSHAAAPQVVWSRAQSLLDAPSYLRAGSSRPCHPTGPSRAAPAMRREPISLNEGRGCSSDPFAKLVTAAVETARTGAR